jgi:hypothetical protein
MWGQYPALMGKPDSVVNGAVYGIRTVADAQKVAEYETRITHRWPAISATRMASPPHNGRGIFSVFVGIPEDLSEGTFDLRVW